MRAFTLHALACLIFILYQPILYAQPVDLGVASGFAVFTAAGAFSNDGATEVTGDIGTNVGAFTGFPPGIVIGSIHVADVISAQAATDVAIAYGQLSAMTCGVVLGTSLGSGQILTPNIFCLGAASTLDGDLILDGQCDPDAIFVFQIDGALATTSMSNVILVNSASLCNVYWQVNGAVTLGPSCVFRGNIVAAGAIHTLEGAVLFGRALTTAGAIDMHNNIVNNDMLPEASILVAAGATTFCDGDSVTLTGNCGGTWNTGSISVTITVSSGGDYFVTNANNCGSSTSNHILVTVNALPICSITGDPSVCEGQSTLLCGSAGMAAYLWDTGETTECVTVNAAGTYTVTITDSNGCTSSCSQSITVNPLPICTITGNLTICSGESTVLCTTAGLASYLWSTGEKINCITVNAAGTYTVTITDVNGCTSSCSQTVTVIPSPICTMTGNLTICSGESTVLCTTAGLASYLWSTGETINCITVNAAGTYIVTVTDINGCTSSCSQTITVSPPPICTITGNLTICSGGSTVLCTTAGLASYLWSTGETINCITVNAAGTYIVTVTDINGCTSSCSQTITVSPPPICTITGNLTICSGESTVLCTTAGLAGYLWSTGETINCITVNAAGTYTVTVTDANGCSSSCSQTVTVIPPPICTITGNLSICAGESTVLCTTAGLAGYLWSTGETINCITVNAAGTYTVTVTDANGCSSSCSQTVMISLGSEPPMITCPVDVTLECDENTLPSNTGFAIATDICGASLAVNFNDMTLLNGCGQAFTITRIWTATDANGNTITCSQTIAVQDNTAPVITCPVVLSPIECGAAPNFGTPTAIDACGGMVNITFTEVTFPGLCPQAYSVTRTWTATDECGNSAQCSVTIDVQDNTAPVITCPVVLSPIECGSSPNFGTPTAIDACDAMVNITFTDVTLPGLCPQAYSVTRTWTATDGCGNSVQCSATIDVQDNTAPVITCPVVLSPIECGAAPNFGTPTAIDACGGIVNMTFTDVTLPGLCPQAYSVTRTWTATDDCGNSTQCSATIDIQDNTAPILTCPVVVSPIQCGAAPNFGTPIAIDACGGMVNITFTDVTLPGLCPQAYSVTRTWTATDECGNSAQCSATIDIQDNTAPILTCPVVVSPIQCGSAPNFGTPTAIDACGGIVNMTFTDVTLPGLCPQAYSVTRTWTATDECGNSAQCSATIDVQDNAAPVITCPVVVSPVECGSTPTFGTPTAVDACDGTVDITFSDVTVPGQCPQEYSVTRTWTATDDCGNSSSCSATIVIQDNVPPVITLPQSISNGDTLRVQCYGQDPAWDLPVYNANSVVAIDACGGNTVVSFNESLENEGNCGLDGYINLYRLTWTATDACGNSSMAFAFLALVDTIAPVIYGIPVDITVNCDQVPLPPVLVYATDECLCACIILFQESDSTQTSGCQDGQVVVRTWTATDRCGNETIGRQYITLIDTSGPALQILQPEIANAQNGTILEYTCSAGGIPTFFNNLSAESVMMTTGCGGSGTITFDSRTIKSRNCEYFGYVEQRTFHWEAIDACGNETNLTIVAQLQDDQAPTIIGLPAMACVGDPQLNDVEAVDDCGNASLRFWETEVRNPCGTGMAVRRTYEAFDDCGNITRDTVILLPNDFTLPIISLVNSNLSLVPGDELLIVPCDAKGGQYTNYGVKDAIVDNTCGVTMDFEERLLSAGDCVQDGYVALLSLIWTATDVCGNQGQEQMLAEVVDTTSPVFMNFKPVMTIGCHDAMPLISTSDNCGDVVMTSIDSIIPGKCEFQYDVIRLITITDACGNSSTRSQTVHVGNSNGPVITGVVANVCDDLTIPVVTAYDECAQEFVEVTMVEDTLELNCHDGVVIQRTWSARDACGNVAKIIQTIILHDQTPPQILIPTYSVINQFIGQDYNLVYLSQTDLMARINGINSNSVVVFDDCDELIDAVLTVDTIKAVNCEAVGYAERRTYTWIAVDICGNSDSLTITVDIMDDIPPVTNELPGDTMIVCAPLPPVPDVFSQDLNPSASVIYTQLIEAGNTLGRFNVTRTWTATDSCHNIATVIQHILWIPESLIQCDILLPDSVECNSHGVFIGSLITGGFGPYTYVWKIVGEKCFLQAGQGTPDIRIYVGWSEVTVTLTVTDIYGCVSICTTTVNCSESFNTFASSPLNVNANENPDHPNSTFHTIWNQDQQDHIQQLTFWPNPAKETVNLGFESSIDQDLEVTFLNLLNQVVVREKISAHPGYEVHPVDVSKLRNGSYLLEVRSGAEMHTKVVVVLNGE